MFFAVGTFGSFSISPSPTTMAPRTKKGTSGSTTVTETVPAPAPAPATEEEEVSTVPADEAADKKQATKRATNLGVSSAHIHAIGKKTNRRAPVPSADAQRIMNYAAQAQAEMAFCNAALVFALKEGKLGPLTGDVMKQIIHKQQ